MKWRDRIFDAVRWPKPSYFHCIYWILICVYALFSLLAIFHMTNVFFVCHKYWELFIYMQVETSVVNGSNKFDYIFTSLYILILVNSNLVHCRIRLHSSLFGIVCFLSSKVTFEHIEKNITKCYFANKNSLSCFWRNYYDMGSTQTINKYCLNWGRISYSGLQAR